MLQRLAWVGFLLLALLLPVQNLLAQYSDKILGLPSTVNLWKEGVVIIIGLYLICDIIYYCVKNRIQYKKLIPLGIITLLSLWSAFSTLVINHISLSIFALGFRFELLWLWFFVLVWTHLTIIPDSFLTKKQNLQWLSITIITSLIVTHIISLLTILFGQQAVLSPFGYGVERVGSIVDYSPITHVIDGGGYNSAPRLAGTFSTPNHYAGYLLLTLPITVWSIISTKKRMLKVIYSLAALASLGFLILTFARFSWLGLFLIFSFLGVLVCKKRYPTLPNLLTKITLFLAFIIPVFVGIIAINVPPETLQSLPASIAKPSSTELHYRHTIASLSLIKEGFPKSVLAGFGLAATGPAAKMIYYPINKAEIITRFTPIAYQNGLVEADLTIPESWFLQLVLNGGIFYALLYTLLVLLPLHEIHKLFTNKNFVLPTYTDITKFIFPLAFLAIIIGNLFLHLWENQTVAIYWTMLYLFQYSAFAITSSKD